MKFNNWKVVQHIVWLQRPRHSAVSSSSVTWISILSVLSLWLLILCLFFWCSCFSSPHFWSICFCLVIASTFSCLLLLVMSLTSWFLLTAFSCACFLAFAAPSLIVVSMYIMYSDFPKQRIIVNSLLTFVLLSRDFKSHCLINLCSDFSFGSGCLLVV